MYLVNINYICMPECSWTIPNSFRLLQIWYPQNKLSIRMYGSRRLSPVLHLSLCAWECQGEAVWNFCSGAANGCPLNLPKCCSKQDRILSSESWMSLENLSCLLDLHKQPTVSHREMKESGDIWIRRRVGLGKEQDRRALCCLDKLC